MSSSLNGLHVLVTRPEHQAGPLCRLIEKHDGVAIRCPALVISEPRDWKPALAIFDRLQHYDLAIFTSANAVDRSLPLIRERGGVPPQLEIAAIGKATAQVLTRHGIVHSIRPDQGFTSEALLTLARLQNVVGQHIVIVRGEGGRELLTETLTARGAHVEHAEVYRRERPTVDSATLPSQRQLEAVDAAVITSGESLSNLFDMLGADGQDDLRKIPLIVVSARVRRIAETLGCRCVLLAQEADDHAVVAALLHLTASSSSSVR